MNRLKHKALRADTYITAYNSSLLMNLTPQDRSSTTTLVAALFAAAALFVAFVLATQLALAVVGLSYARWLLQGATSGGGTIEGLTSMAGTVNEQALSLLSQGVARGGLLIVAFIGGMIALRRARRLSFFRTAALGLSVLMIILAAMMVLMCGIRFALADVFHADEFIACVLLTVLFVALSLTPVYLYRQPWLCRIYAMPFVILIAVQFGLVVFAPGSLALNAKFLGNVALVIVLVGITGALVYASRLMRHLMT